MNSAPMPKIDAPNPSKLVSVCSPKAAGKQHKPAMIVIAPIAINQLPSLGVIRKPFLVGDLLRTDLKIFPCRGKLQMTKVTGYSR